MEANSSVELAEQKKLLPCRAPMATPSTAPSVSIYSNTFDQFLRCSNICHRLFQRYCSCPCPRRLFLHQSPQPNYASTMPYIDILRAFSPGDGMTIALRRYGGELWNATLKPFRANFKQRRCHPVSRAHARTRTSEYFRFDQGSRRTDQRRGTRTETI